MLFNNAGKKRPLRPPPLHPLPRGESGEAALTAQGNHAHISEDCDWQAIMVIANRGSSRAEMMKRLRATCFFPTAALHFISLVGLLDPAAVRLQNLCKCLSAFVV